MPEIHQRFGKNQQFLIEKELGAGSFGTVYKALDLSLDSHVALKIPRLIGHKESDREVLAKRFHREAKTIAKLPPNSHLCPIREYGECDGELYLAMPFLEGDTLAVVMPSLSIIESCQTVLKIAEGMSVVHQQGAIHRDLKPANVMIVGGDPIVTDFGLGKILDICDSLSNTQEVVGTPAYMPVEQFDPGTGTVGPRSDIYALGVILYECLANRLPYRGGLMQLFGQAAQGKADPPSRWNLEVAPELDRICLKAMARDAADRYASMADFHADLSRFLSGTGPLDEEDAITTAAMQVHAADELPTTHPAVAETTDLGIATGTDTVSASQSLMDDIYSRKRREVDEIVQRFHRLGRKVASQLDGDGEKPLQAYEFELKQAADELHRAFEAPKLILAAAGTTSSGKSTLVNLLCGDSIMPEAVGEMTAGP